MIYVFFDLIFEALNDYAKESYCPKDCNESMQFLELIMPIGLFLALFGFVLFACFANSIERHWGLENRAKEVDEINSIIK